MIVYYDDIINVYYDDIIIVYYETFKRSFLGSTTSIWDETSTPWKLFRGAGRGIGPGVCNASFYMKNRVKGGVLEGKPSNGQNSAPRSSPEELLVQNWSSFRRASFESVSFLWRFFNNVCFFQGPLLLGNAWPPTRAVRPFRRPPSRSLDFCLIWRY